MTLNIMLVVVGLLYLIAALVLYGPVIALLTMNDGVPVLVATLIAGPLAVPGIVGPVLARSVWLRWFARVHGARAPGDDAEDDNLGPWGAEAGEAGQDFPTGRRRLHGLMLVRLLDEAGVCPKRGGLRPFLAPSVSMQEAEARILRGGGGSGPRQRASVVGAKRRPHSVLVLQCITPQIGVRSW